ncbi:negative regulator of type III secretion [Waddlia chondrophila 2032/99]|uniref:Negative regulator of type III secretion n=2 Tax=Waddlia chondrophila TaxID=71667 RepID=F8LA37_9BACT|nr:HrpJ domain-containing protein [Waddlia chondrophila]ADI38214.1 putative type III secreted protein SctW [Waddlia chondrophila WSU 86-1044]CCB90344.1 negative regulator of type III secretion [Waddlia chondrophila 2032/99]
MFGGGAGGIQGPHARQTLEAMKEVGKETAEEVRQEQKVAAQSAQASNALTAFRPKVKTEKKKLKQISTTVAKMAKMKKEKKLLPIQQIAKKAEEHERKNPELKAKVLKLLRERIKPDSSSEDIQEILDEFYPDPTLADDAMEFLLDTTEGQLHQQVQEAKEKLNEDKGREITAGRNISKQARQASDKGLGTPTSLREMYRDITGNPRDSNTMFQELSEKYAFKEMHKVVKFLLHSLGSDMKSKGPSISRGELHRLITETRSLQAILGVYRFFKTRMGLMEKMFAKSGLDMPKKLNFELMSKCFMNLAGERYPSSDKVLAQAKRLGIEDWILAKIIAFSQFRDSIKEMAMSQIYRSLQHRDELLFAIIEALEELEDQLEELEEQDEEEEDWEEDEEEEEK